MIEPKHKVGSLVITDRDILVFNSLYSILRGSIGLVTSSKSYSVYVVYLPKYERCLCLSPSEIRTLSEEGLSEEG